MDASQIEKLKTLALAPAERVEACIADVMARFPTDSKDYYVEVHQHLAPLARQLERANDELRAEVERLRARFEYIEGNATTHGGGNGFTVSFFVPEDSEDIGCGIDAAIEKEKA